MTSLVVAFTLACHTPRPPPAAPAPPPLPSFEQRIVEVVPGVHVAIGYGLANVMLLVGDGGDVVIDTMESAEAAAPVKAAFDAISSQPVEAMIYTHNHADHVFGAAVMAGDDEPDIYAHALTNERIDAVINVVRPAIYTRSMRQFGTELSPELANGGGIGPGLRYGRGATVALLRPTHSFEQQLSLDIAGLELELVHAPGETPDELFVWLPGPRVLFCGDNYYEAFPNLYAIRGTPYRDVLDWVASLDAMRALRPAVLVPSHTDPVFGEDEVQARLTDYRDAIQFVHDETVRGINAGVDPIELAATVKLPPHLAAKPWLQQTYGRVDWSVRAIYTGYLGWFGGNATDLAPLTTGERAEHLARLGGGVEGLLVAAAASDDPRWTLELADAVLALDPDSADAIRLRAAALVEQAEGETSMNGWNYRQTQALELAQGLEIGGPDLSTMDPALVHSFPLDSFFRAMSIALNVERAADVDQLAEFRFPDAGEVWSVHVRRGVAEVQPRSLGEADVVLTVDSRVWKELLAGMRGPGEVVGELESEGGMVAAVRFLGLFDA